MKAMIVETCFVEATEDVALYKRLGPDAVGKKIAESIANNKTELFPYQIIHQILNLVIE